MISLYKSIWSDAINYERIKNGGESHWKLFTFVYMTLILSLNVITILSLIRFIFNIEVGEFLMMLFKRIIDNKTGLNFLWFFIVAILPSSLINYMLVFYNNRYENILEKYKFKQGKLSVIYFIITVISFFGVSLIKKYLA